MTVATQTIIKQTGAVAVDYTLEFRTWDGADYVWTDYTDRLIDFSGIGSQVELDAFPNAFRMTMGSVTVDNRDLMFNNLAVLDGLLTNYSEPYGKNIYKRMLRITDVRNNESKVLGVALVRDVRLNSRTQTAIIETISLDARAADQKCDAPTAQRHALGDTFKITPAVWTIEEPDDLTDPVNMYRWREEEIESGEVNFGWFKDRHYAEVIERTAWALDDLATDITRSFRLLTADGREIVTQRNIPPDDPAISTGVTPERCRALVWNPERNVLVCCVGHKIYDYDPATNVYTLRNTLTAGRDVVRAFYTTEPDAAAVATRIVLVQCDINAYANTALRVTTAWCTTLDASGTGAYTVLDSERSMGTNVFPGTHSLREGTVAGSDRFVYGENVHNPFRQTIDTMSAATDSMFHQDFDTAVDSIFADPTPDPESPPQTVGRGWSTASRFFSTDAIGYRFSYGFAFSASLNTYQAGGRLYYQTWDSTNGYRLNYINLSTYASGSYSALPGAATRVPYFLYSPQDATYKKRLYVCQMQWIDTATDYSIGEVHFYDHSTATWAQITFMSGATGSDQAWMVTEVCHWQNIGGVQELSALLYNRETLKYRYCTELCSDTGLTAAAWADTDARCTDDFTNGQQDQDNPLRGLVENTNYYPTRIYFVEEGANFIWYSDEATGVTRPAVVNANKTPADADQGEPVNSDRGLGSNIVFTGPNYPDTDSPHGVQFWVTANDYIDAGTDHPAGRYVLVQLANFDSGFIELLDLSGLSFWELRTLLAEAFGFVHYYGPDGTLVFKPRATTGASSFDFSDSNRNYIRGEIQTRGFEAVLNDITVLPYVVQSEVRVSEIVKGYNETDADGLLDDVMVSANPGEASQWRVVFVSATTYDLYKLQGSGSSGTTAKVTGQSIDTMLRTIPDGAYLSIAPENFTGLFLVNDNFTFWVLEPQESLVQRDRRDQSRAVDETSVLNNQRAARPFDNRFVRRQNAPDYAANILAWRKDRHDIVRIDAMSDPNYQPLMRCTLTDVGLGYDATPFQIMGVSSRKHQPSQLTLARVYDSQFLGSDDTIHAGTYPTQNVVVGVGFTLTELSMIDKLEAYLDIGVNAVTMETKAAIYNNLATPTLIAGTETVELVFPTTGDASADDGWRTFRFDGAKPILPPGNYLACFWAKSNAGTIALRYDGLGAGGGSSRDFNVYAATWPASLVSPTVDATDLFNVKVFFTPL